MNTNLSSSIRRQIKNQKDNLLRDSVNIKKSQNKRKKSFNKGKKLNEKCFGCKKLYCLWHEKELIDKKSQGYSYRCNTNRRTK